MRPDEKGKIQQAMSPARGGGAPLMKPRVLVASILLAILLLANGVFAAYYLPQSEVIEKGDTAVIDLVIYNGDGQPIYATNKAEAAALLNETGFQTIFDRYHPRFGAFVIPVTESTNLPGDLTRLFMAELVGHESGSTFFTDTHQTPYGDWESGPDMPRMAGPFPLSPRVPATLFETYYPDAEEGDVITLTARVQVDARVISTRDDEVVYRNLVEHGDRLFVDVMNLPATVVLTGDNETFWLRYDLEPGDEFSVRGSCGPPFYTLEPGSYKVTAVSEDAIGLEYNPTPYPPLVGEDLYTRVDVLDVEKFTAKPYVGWALNGLATVNSQLLE